MFDKNLEDFVQDVGLVRIQEIVLNAPEGFDTYLKSNGKYFKRGKQLYYSSDEIKIDDLGYITLVLQGVSCGSSFKDKLYEKRAKELLEKVVGSKGD